jgi:hypothetical protein
VAVPLWAAGWCDEQSVLRSRCLAETWLLAAAQSLVGACIHHVSSFKGAVARAANIRIHERAGVAGQREVATGRGFEGKEE